MPDDKVFAEILALLPPTPMVVRGKMFGAPCLKVNDKVFASLWEDGITVKIPAADVPQALQLAGVTAFDPMKNGRLMKEWIFLAPAARKLWVEYAVKSYNYLVSLGDSACGKKRKAGK
jgi:hypothetical protein